MRSHFEELDSIIPPERQAADPDSLKTYGRDWTKYFEPHPSRIVFPQSTDEVRRLVLWARKHRIALVPSGGRTGLSSGAVAAKGEVVVSLERMNSLLEFDSADGSLRVQAGMITETVQQIAHDKGLYFPVDFASRGSSQIGGNVATNAGGIKVLKYGMIRNWISGLTVVTGSGEVLSLNRGLVKNATGYDFRHLFIGSEGTLGIVTEVTLKLTTPPGPLRVLLMGVNDLKAVMEVFETFRSQTPLIAFEMFTEKALHYVLQNATDLQRPFETKAAYYLLAEVEVSSDAEFEKALNAFEKCVEKSWVIDGVISQSEAQAKNFWRLREDISEACSRYTPYKNDVSVRISKVPEFMAEIDSTLQASYPDLEVVWFGHIGDGNLHISILKPEGLSMGEFVGRCRRIDEALSSVIQKLEGSLSAEHGVGMSKKPFLSFTRSSSEIELMRQVKRVFDPDGIINPGKIFD